MMKKSTLTSIQVIPHPDPHHHPLLPHGIFQPLPYLQLAQLQPNPIYSKPEEK